MLRQGWVMLSAPFAKGSGVETFQAVPKVNVSQPQCTQLLLRYFTSSALNHGALAGTEEKATPPKNKCAASKMSTQ